MIGILMDNDRMGQVSSLKIWLSRPPVKEIHMEMLYLGNSPRCPAITSGDVLMILYVPS